MSKIVNILLIAIATIIAVVLAEGAARLFLDPVDFLLPEMEVHSALNHRIRANSAGHDMLGFRNSRVAKEAPIVAIGDSMTYGVAASHNGSWPRQLERKLDEKVYNMALGGYGPIHYLYLLKELAIPMNPKKVVLGFFVGNDLMDSYNLVYSNEYWKHLRGGDSGETVAPSDLISIDPAAGKRFANIRAWLAQKSILYRLVTQSILANPVRRLEAKALNSGLIEVQVPGGVTYLSPETRWPAINLSDSKVREGLELSLWALLEISRLCEQADIELLVILIPTKESVYRDLVQEQAIDLAGSSYDALLSSEDLVLARIVEVFEQNGIAYQDLFEPLQEGVREQMIYPENDGHPNVKGYEIIAGEVAEIIKSAAMPVSANY